MSGFEIAGIVLGGLPIVFKAAENYKQGLEPLIKWRRYQSNFRNFVSDVDIERQMFDGLCTRLLGYTDLSQEQKNLLLTGQDSTGWCSSETEIALKKRLGASYDSCQYLLNLMGEDLLKLQEILSLKDGSVSLQGLIKMYVRVSAHSLLFRLTGSNQEKSNGSIKGKGSLTASVPKGQTPSHLSTRTIAGFEIC